MTCLGCQFPSIAAFPVYVDVSVCSAARQTVVSCLTPTLGWLSESLFIPGVNIHLSSAARLEGRPYDVWWKMTACHDVYIKATIYAANYVADRRFQLP